MKPPAPTYSLRALATAATLPARTVRYYISRGLLDGPAKAGRGSAYTAAHLERLRDIQRRQTRGESLAEIRSAASPELHAPACVTWRRYAVADGVELMLRDDIAPWRARLAARQMQELQRALRSQTTK